jgi:hypothetical protein
VNFSQYLKPAHPDMVIRKEQRKMIADWEKNARGMNDCKEKVQKNGCGKTGRYPGIGDIAA